MEFQLINKAQVENHGKRNATAPPPPPPQEMQQNQHPASVAPPLNSHDGQAVQTTYNGPDEYSLGDGGNALLPPKQPLPQHQNPWSSQHHPIMIPCQQPWWADSSSPRHLLLLPWTLIMASQFKLYTTSHHSTRTPDPATMVLMVWQCPMVLVAPCKVLDLLLPIILW